MLLAWGDCTAEGTLPLDDWTIISMQAHPASLAANHGLGYSRTIDRAGASFAAVEQRRVFSGNLGVQRGVAASQAESAFTRLKLGVIGPLAAFRNDLTTTTFPSDCRLCDGPLTAYSTTPVCTVCLGLVAPQQDSLCHVCGEALGMESARFAASQGGSTCTACRLVPPGYTRAVAYAAYDDELRELLHLLKYEGMQRLADAPLGCWLAEAIATIKTEAASELAVIAVPLFSSRERERGFNQSVVLADAAVAHLRKQHRGWKLTPLHGALRRTRDTEAQFSLQPRARRRNMRGAFAVSPSASLQGKEVLLIDDIMTTGATARECARVLLRAGAAKVWVATVARAQAEAATTIQPGEVARWGSA